MTEKNKVKFKVIKKIKFFDSREFFKTLFDYAPDPYYISDLEGILIDGNRSAETITGYQKEELVGKNFFQLNILPSYEIPKAQQAFARNQQGLTSGPDEFTLKRKDNKEIAVEIFTYPIKVKGEMVALSIARDISKRKRVEKDLSERNKELNFLYRISKIMGDPNISVDQTLLSIVELLPSALQYPEFVCASIQINSHNFKTRSFQETKWKQSIPIIVQNQPIGRLEVFYLKAISQSEDDPFLKEERDLINSLTRRINQYLERKKAEDALKKSQQEFIGLFQSNPEATIYTDEKGNILNINIKFTDLFGYTLEEVKGENIDSDLIQPPDKIQEARKLTEKGKKEQNISIETIRKKKDGTLVPVYISGSTVMINGQPKGMIATYYDISERKKIEKQLEKLLRIDTLTGCYSRGYGLELLERQIKLSQRNQSHLLIAFLDIDHFKTINDTFGHNEGDQVLKEVVKLFKSSLREVDIICRMGGDEFLLVFPDSSLKEGPLIRERLQKKLTQLNKHTDMDYAINLSMGFSEYLADKPKNSDDLISIADQRMYEEKNSKKKSV